MKMLFYFIEFLHITMRTYMREIKALHKSWKNDFINIRTSHQLVPDPLHLSTYVALAENTEIILVICHILYA